MTNLPDRRLNAYRPDLAETALQGVVEAERFTDGSPSTVAVPVCDLRPRPDPASGIDTQLLFGEPVSVLDRDRGWAWVKAGIDGYVGYLRETCLDATALAPTHIVTAPRTFVYSGADLRFRMRHALSMGSRLAVTGEAETRGTRYLLLDGGEAVIAAHCAALAAPLDGDYVSIAARFLETPYLWGGRTGFGIDCSGLVQLSMMMAGKVAPRDSDMQAKGLGQSIERGDLRRGDLVFWKGHVAIVEDEKTILHANGHTMTVAREGLEAAIERIRWLYAEPTGYRRP